MAWSLSKIQCFEQCKLKYKFQYIDKIQQIPTRALAKGSKIHSILEDIKTINPDNLNNTIQDTVSKIDSLNTNLKDNSTEIKSAELDLESLNVVKSFIESKTYNTFKNILVSETAVEELEIGLKIHNNKLIDCSFYDEDCLYRGKIDVLDKNVIIDYKTGKAKEYQWQDFTQLEWYSIWVFLTHPDIYEITGHFIYVEHSVINSKTFYRKDLNSMIKRMLTRIRNAVIFNDKVNSKTDNILIKSPSKLCEWCQYKEMCNNFLVNGSDNK